MPQFTTRQLVLSLRSTICPACRGQKKHAQTLCVACYRSLPRELQKALYNRVGEGYEQAFGDAMVALEVKSPMLAEPEATP